MYSIDVFDAKLGKKHHYNGDHLQLLNLDNHFNKLGLRMTGYHRLFVGSHAVFHMKNQTVGDDAPTVLIIGDSQSVPVIPILCHYCKELVYIDVRCQIPICKELISTITFDKRIVQMYNDKNIKLWRKYVHTQE